jgi:hypothetical protein
MAAVRAVEKHDGVDDLVRRAHAGAAHRFTSLVSQLTGSITTRDV